MAVIEVTAAVIRRGGQVLIASRKNEGWEFPGGKIEPGETPASALRRELAEELAMNDVYILDEIYWITHAYPEKTVRLHFMRTLLPDGAEFAPCEGQQIRWITLPELFTCGLLPADRPLADFLNGSSRKEF